MRLKTCMIARTAPEISHTAIAAPTDTQNRCLASRISRDGVVDDREDGGRDVLLDLGREVAAPTPRRATGSRAPRARTGAAGSARRTPGTRSRSRRSAGRSRGRCARSARTTSRGLGRARLGAQRATGPRACRRLRPLPTPLPTDPVRTPLDKRSARQTVGEVGDVARLDVRQRRRARARTARRGRPRRSCSPHVAAPATSHSWPETSITWSAGAPNASVASA